VFLELNLFLDEVPDRVDFYAAIAQWGNPHSPDSNAHIRLGAILLHYDAVF